MAEGIKMFKKGRTILYFGESLDLKQKLESSLNEVLSQVSSVDDLAFLIGDTQGENLTIILTPNMSENFTGFLGSLTAILEGIVDEDRNSVVIELGFETPFIRSTNPKIFRYPDADSLIEDKRREIRGATVLKAKETGQSEYVIAYKEFELEIEELKDELKEERIDKDFTETQLKELKREFNVRDSLASRLENERSKLDDIIEKFEEEVGDLKNRLKVLNLEVEDLRKKNSEYSSQSSSLRYERDALNMDLRARKEDLSALKYELKSLKEDLKDEKQSKENLIHKLSGADKYKGLEEVVKELEKELSVIKEEVTQLNIKNSRLKYENDGLEEELESLKEDDVDLAKIGRSRTLAKTRFKTVDVYYFKIYQELPYINTYIKKFIELLNEDDRFGIVKTMIIRHDEGLDGVYFKGIRLYNNLFKASQEGDKTFRLFPTGKMFIGQEEFEDSTDTVVVLDYVKSEEYLVETDSYNRKFVVVNNSRTKNILGIEGNEISQSPKSKLDMNYSEEIGQSTTKSVKDSLITVKIREWMKVMEI